MIKNEERRMAGVVFLRGLGPSTQAKGMALGGEWLVYLQEQERLQMWEDR